MGENAGTSQVRIVISPLIRSVARDGASPLRRQARNRSPSLREPVLPVGASSAGSLSWPVVGAGSLTRSFIALLLNASTPRDGGRGAVRAVSEHRAREPRLRVELHATQEALHDAQPQRAGH